MKRGESCCSTRLHCLRRATSSIHPSASERDCLRISTRPVLSRRQSPGRAISSRVPLSRIGIPGTDREFLRLVKDFVPAALERREACDAGLLSLIRVLECFFAVHILSKRCGCSSVGEWRHYPAVGKGSNPFARPNSSIACMFAKVRFRRPWPPLRVLGGGGAALLRAPRLHGLTAF